jgi:putative DNA primase/helicase
VFPCRRDKKPYVATGFKAATKAPAQIKRWWSQWPDACIGVPTGPASGVLVLDTDTEEATAEAERRGLPLTPMSRTGKGGHHYVFLHVGQHRNAVSLFPKCDRRGDGGYIIVPPSASQHGTYEWLVPPFNGTPFGEPPKWVLERPQKEREPAPQPPSGATPWGRTVLSDEAEVVRTTPQGQRNAALNRAAFRVGQALVAGQLDRRAAEDTLVAAVENSQTLPVNFQDRPPFAELQEQGYKLPDYPDFQLQFGLRHDIALAGKPVRNQQNKNIQRNHVVNIGRCYQTGGVKQNKEQERQTEKAEFAERI